MKSKLHIGFSIFLVALITLSSIGYTATKHLCGGKVVLTAISFTQKELSCGMQKKQSSCPRHKKMTSQCCSNQHELNQLQENFNPSKLGVQKVQAKRTLGLTISLISKLGYQWTKWPDSYKVPPDIVEDYTKWFQVMRL